MIVIMRQRTMKTKSKETRSEHPGSLKFKNWFAFIALSSQQHEHYFVSRVSSMFLNVEWNGCKYAFLPHENDFEI